MKEKMFQEMFLQSLRATGKKRDLKDLQFHLCQAIELDIRRAFYLTIQMHRNGDIQISKGKSRYWVSMRK